jgi:alpha-L-fucosidase
MLTTTLLLTGLLLHTTPGAPPANTAPPGFTAVFNGTDLAGWKGLVADPVKRAAMSPADLAAAQRDADTRMRDHWSAKDGVLVYDGKGDSICTSKDFANFEMYVDWKIEKGGDSGIYLRGSPQVQIWDNPDGSGGLYNNQKNPAKPLVAADNPVGEWNTFHIIMQGDRVTVYLNGRLVTDDTVLENYWDRSKPMFPTGQIELQNHNNPLAFRNIYVRELPAAEPRDTRFEWFDKARFGMFVHWGLYAIPAGEWNGKVYPGAAEWLMDMAKIPPSDYEKLAPRFNPVKFDAAKWSDIAKRAGQKYMVITSKHHDGFSLFDSKFSEYDVMDATPFKRDIMKELAASNAAAGVRMCWYHSIMDWHHPLAKGADFPKYAEVLKNQVRELLTNYGPIGIMWFDGEWIGEWTEPQGKELYKLCRELQPDVIVNNRVGKGRSGMAGMSKDSDAAGDYGTPEQEIPATGFPGLRWESCMTMNGSWGFHAHDTNWKSSRTLIRMLVETASKGGNFLLNVGPTAEGEIPAASVERLAAVGDWLAVHAEAIYGTTASPFKKLPWGRATSRPGRLYLIVEDWPADGSLRVPGLTTEVRGAWLMTDPKFPALSFTRADADLLVKVPARMPNEDASVVVLDLAGDAVVAATRITPGPDGVLDLQARDADVHGDSARYEHGGGKDNIGYWVNQQDSVTWDATLPRAGKYKVSIEYACENGSEGADFMVFVNDAGVGNKVDATGGWATFKRVDLGTLETFRTGDAVVRVVAKTKPGYAVMNLKSVRLTPVK